MDGADHCNGTLLEHAATNKYNIQMQKCFINDDTDELDVTEWDTMQVRKQLLLTADVLRQGVASPTHDTFYIVCLAALVMFIVYV